MCPSMGERGETLHFSIPSINQSGSFGSIFLALAAPSTMVPIHAKSYFHIWLHIVDALNRTTWFCSCAIYTNLNYIDLKNYRIKISKKEVILPHGWRGRFLIFRGRWPGGLLTCSPMCQCFTKPIRVPHEAEQWQKQHMVKLEKMREKRIQQRVK